MAVFASVHNAEVLAVLAARAALQIKLVPPPEALEVGGPYPALVFSGIFTMRRRRRDCLQKVFCRRFIAKSHGMTALIIIDPPSLNQALCLGQGFEPVDI